eukprot:s4979_g1.t1
MSEEADVPEYRVQVKPRFQ